MPLTEIRAMLEVRYGFPTSLKTKFIIVRDGAQLSEMAHITKQEDRESRSLALSSERFIFEYRRGCDKNSRKSINGILSRGEGYWNLESIAHKLSA
jgi:hypothetical protein